MELRESLEKLRLQIIDLKEQEYFQYYLTSLSNQIDVAENIEIVLDEIQSTLKENDLYLSSHYEVLVENYYSLLNFYEEILDSSSWFSTKEILQMMSLNPKINTYDIFFKPSDIPFVKPIDLEDIEWGDFVPDNQNLEYLDIKCRDIVFLSKRCIKNMEEVYLHLKECRNLLEIDGDDKVEETIKSINLKIIAVEFKINNSMMNELDNTLEYMNILSTLGEILNDIDSLGEILGQRDDIKDELSKIEQELDKDYQDNSEIPSRKVKEVNDITPKNPSKRKRVGRKKDEENSINTKPQSVKTRSKKSNSDK